MRETTPFEIKKLILQFLGETDRCDNALRTLITIIPLMPMNITEPMIQSPRASGKDQYSLVWFSGIDIFRVEVRLEDTDKVWIIHKRIQGWEVQVGIFSQELSVENFHHLDSREGVI
jgi:hypothetical protein